MSLIKSAILKLKELAFIGLDDVIRIDVKHIPHEWTPFSDKGDYWKRLVLSSGVNADCCEYYAPKGMVFGVHVHDNDELWHCYAKVELKTPKETRIIEPGQVVYIPAEVPHRAKFLTAGTLILSWHPAFDKGWIADMMPDESLRTNEFIDNGLVSNTEDV